MSSLKNFIMAYLKNNLFEKSDLWAMIRSYGEQVLFI